MENNGNKIYIVLALLVGLAGGYYYGSATYYSKGYEQARTEIKTTLENKRIIEPVAKDIRVISGKIQFIGTNQFVIESQVAFDPTVPDGQQAKSITKTITISPSTSINTRTVVENKAIPKAGEAFRPFIVQNVKVDFSTLKVGDQVVVEANENIADKASFEAVAVSKNGQ